MQCQQYCIKHYKDIKTQQKQNQFYMQILKNGPIDNDPLPRRLRDKNTRQYRK